ncbi:unnamed protein product [Blepharisma stoltei]|uniref:CNH domain-containing protein n=1 Tax=Blepharisma stoltei TaxID=1481888 RepID=A0AAU9IY42_9CILI|nr:unnamed protein product [Blepharisma stoltei]
MAKVYRLATLLETENRITSLECIKGKIYTGDSRGQILSYSLIRAGTPEETLASTQIGSKLGKSRIEKLKGDKEINILYAFSEGTLVAFDLDLLEEVQSFGKNFSGFAVNEHPNFHGKICTVQKRKITTYNWSPSLRNNRNRLGGYLVDKDNFMIPDVPAVIVWYGTNICIGFHRRNYLIINSEDGRITDIQVPSATTNYTPYIKVVGSEFFCLWGNNLLLPFDSDTGQNAMRNPISFAESKHLVSAGYHDPYLTVMTENSIEVFNAIDGMPVQQESLPQGSAALALADTDYPMICATTAGIMTLRPVPVNEQITKLLTDCRIPEARALIEKHIDPTALDADAQYEQFNLDAAWCLFKELRFKDCIDYFMPTNFDPRDIMSLFPEYCDEKVSRACMTQTNIRQVVRNNLAKKGNSFDSRNISEAEYDRILTCKFYVITLLQQKREPIFKPPKAARTVGTYQFLNSPFSVNRLTADPITRDEALEMIDTFLLKCIVDIGSEDRSASKFIDHFKRTHLTMLEGLFDPLYKPQLNFNESERYLKEKKDPYALAMLYEAFVRKVEALKIFRELGADNNKGIQEQAAKQTVKVLLKVSDKQTIFEYSQWVLNAFPLIGLEVFTSPDETHHISYDTVLEHLATFEREVPLVEIYLKWLVEVKLIDAERFHTRLALCYIDKLFRMLPRDSFNDVPPEGVNTSTFIKYGKDLLMFLETSKNYRGSTILEEIRNSWLIEAEVLLLSKEKRHMEALHILVNNGMLKGDFEKAEKYCITHCDNLLTQLLKIYIEKALNYETLMKESQEPKMHDDAQNMLMRFQNCAFKLLQKYATNPELNPLLVMDIIPDHWSLSAATSNSLQLYLHVALSHSLHTGRVTKIIKHLSDMDAIQTECEWYNCRKSSVRISNERLCDLCKKRISDRPFAVYPNGKVVHQSCTKSPNICPVTLTNFENLT